jgi:hypothetical protein
VQAQPAFEHRLIMLTHLFPALSDHNRTMYPSLSTGENIAKSEINTKDRVKVKINLLKMTRRARQYHGFHGGVSTGDAGIE